MLWTSRQHSIFKSGLIQLHAVFCCRDVLGLHHLKTFYAYNVRGCKLGRRCPTWRTSAVFGLDLVLHYHRTIAWLRCGRSLTIKKTFSFARLRARMPPPLTSGQNRFWEAAQTFSFQPAFNEMQRVSSYCIFQSDSRSISFELPNALPVINR